MENLKKKKVVSFKDRKKAANKTLYILFLKRRSIGPRKGYTELFLRSTRFFVAQKEEGVVVFRKFSVRASVTNIARCKFSRVLDRTTSSVSLGALAVGSREDRIVRWLNRNGHRRSRNISYISTQLWEITIEFSKNLSTIFNIIVRFPGTIREWFPIETTIKNDESNKSTNKSVSERHSILFAGFSKMDEHERSYTRFCPWLVPSGPFARAIA